MSSVPSAAGHDSPGPWRWMIFLARFVWAVIGLGNYKSMGIFLPHITHAFSTDTAVVGTASSALVALGGIIGPFMPVVIAAIGARRTVMLGGSITGVSLIVASFSSSIEQLALAFAFYSFGYTFTLIGMLKPLMDYFPDDFAAANGMSLVGGTVGMISLPPLMEFFVDAYGWRNALALLGAITFHFLVSGALIRPLHAYRRVAGDEVESEPASADQNSGCFDGRSVVISVCRQMRRVVGERFDLRPLSDRKLVAYLIVGMLCGFVFGGWHLYVIPHGLAAGYGSTASAYLATFGGVGSLIGRLGHGFLVDHGLVEIWVLAVLSSVLFALPCLADPLLSRNYFSLAAEFTVAGVFIGILYPLGFVMVRDISGSRAMPSISWLYLFQSTGILSGGLVCGWIYDCTGQYEIVFATMGCIGVVMAIITAISQYLDNTLQMEK